MTDPALLAWLRTPEAVRARAEALFDRSRSGLSPHFTLDLARMDDTASYVATIVRENYPRLDVPHHSRWRHFAAGGIDRWPALGNELQACPAEEVARIRTELVVISVLLDAGAGPDWHFTEPGTDLVLARSEGLAVASLHAFRAGLFSADPADPLRADAAALAGLHEPALGRALQAGAGNPLAGLAGRAAMLRRLGQALAEAGRPRLGLLFDDLRQQAGAGLMPARAILLTLLEWLAPVWPAPLGDVWHHKAVGWVPFHKLSQWLAYSLIEVMEEAGVPVAGIGGLTGLAEYRNGGLFIDMGVLRPDASLVGRLLRVADEPVIEWRALTVALLDRIAPLVRDRLGRSEAEMPLSKVLEGGTWAAGRRIARERRADATPPLQVASDGTVF